MVEIRANGVLVAQQTLERVGLFIIEADLPEAEIPDRDRRSAFLDRPTTTALHRQHQHDPPGGRRIRE